jgi:hypothetical protein
MDESNHPLKVSKLPEGRTHWEVTVLHSRGTL